MRPRSKPSVRAGIALYAIIVLSITAIFYRAHLYFWGLALVDWIGTLHGQPWPGGDNDLMALAYWVNGDFHGEQLGLFVSDLIWAAILGMPATAAIGWGIQRIYDAYRRRYEHWHERTNAVAR